MKRRKKKENDFIDLLKCLGGLLIIPSTLAGVSNAIEDDKVDSMVEFGTVIGAVLKVVGFILLLNLISLIPACNPFATKIIEATNDGPFSIVLFAYPFGGEIILYHLAFRITKLTMSIKNKIIEKKNKKFEEESKNYFFVDLDNTRRNRLFINKGLTKNRTLNYNKEIEMKPELNREQALNKLYEMRNKYTPVEEINNSAKEITFGSRKN